MKKKSNDDYLDSAFFYFNRALQINPYYVQSIHNIGLCYEIKGKIDLAKKITNKQLKLITNFYPL